SAFFFFSYEGQRLQQPVFAVATVPDLAARQASAPATQPLLNAFPLPNGPAVGNGLAQFSGGYTNTITTDATSVRWDQVLNSHLTTFVRYNYSPSMAVTRPTTALSSPNTVRTPVHTFTGGATWMINPSTVNETRFNISEADNGLDYELDSFGGATVPI